MVLGVKFLKTRYYKGRCTGCRRPLKNGQLCIYERGSTARKHCHVECNWTRSATWKIERCCARPTIMLDDDIPPAERASVQARVNAAVRRVRNVADQQRQLAIQRQVENKRLCMREYPVGQRMVHMQHQGQIAFVTILSYSRLGRSIRVRAHAKTVVDSWADGWNDYYGAPVRRTLSLCRADWSAPLDATYAVRTSQLGLGLVKGSDVSRPVEFDAAAITPLEQTDLDRDGGDGGVPTVHVRSVAGRLWYNAEITEELTSAKLRDAVAAQIHLRTARGRITLCHGARVLHGTERLGKLCSGTLEPLELTATVAHNQSWPMTTDGLRYMPYGIEYAVCSESLAFETRLER